jgi:hypothetical protein
VTSLTIGSAVTSIGQSAFIGCNLTTVTIPSSVTIIGYLAFFGGYNLISFDVDLNNPNYSSDSGILFNKNKSTIIQYPYAKIGSSYTIPNTVTTIGDRAFFRCLNLTTMDIPNGVVTIESTAFYFCTNLTNVTLPNNITTIGTLIFGFCQSLRSITIPNTVTSIGQNAFSSSGLTSITIPNNVTSIGLYAFNNCVSLASVTLGSAVTSIGQNAFSDCTSLTSVKFLGNAPSLGTDGFIRTNANLKIYYLRFTSGWTSTFGGKPTIAFTPSFNIIKSGGSGKLTTKKRN